MPKKTEIEENYITPQSGVILNDDGMVDWDKTKEVYGMVSGIRTRQIGEKTSKIATITDKEGEQYDIFLGAVLSTKFDENEIKEYDYIKIIYLGMKKSKAGFKYRNFRLSNIVKQTTIPKDA